MSFGPDYGRSQCAPVLLDRWPRARNVVVSRLQTRMLDGFGWLSRRSRHDARVARVARQLVGSFLYSMKLEVNAACTLRCRMCYVRPSKLQLPHELLSRLFEDLRGCGVRIEILGGEPLLREDLEEIVSAAKNTARSPWVTLYTNALDATPERCARLARAGLDAAIVTVVSHDAATHDAFCGRGGAWANTIKGIENLRDSGIEVYTLTAVHSVNVAHCAAVHDLLRSRLGVHPTFYQYVPQRRGDPLAIAPEKWAEIKRWVLFEQNPGHMDFVRRFCMLTGNSCSGGNFVLTVKADGSVQPCPFVSDLPLGNLRERGIWEIYRSRFDIPALREFKRLPDECESCVYASVCGGGCRAASRTLFGSWAHKDHQCLGPYSEPFDRKAILDRVPTFF